jgi:hypothetical protein
MLSDHELRREHVLNEAVRAGKFTAARAAHYRALYDRDPAGTEQVLAMLAPALEGVPAAVPPAEHGGRVYGRGGSAPAAVVAQAGVAATAPRAVPAAAPEAEGLTPETVAGWSRALFPEVGRETATRVTRAHDA